MPEPQQGGMALVGLGILGAPVLPSPPDTGPGTPEAAVAGLRGAEAILTQARNEKAVWAARLTRLRQRRQPLVADVRQLRQARDRTARQAIGRQIAVLQDDISTLTEEAEDLEPQHTLPGASTPTHPDLCPSHRHTPRPHPENAV